MITLHGITWANPRGYDPLVAAARLWREAHPQVTIEWRQQPWYLFEETILASLAAGDGRYDLIMFDHPWVGKLAEERWLWPWDALVEGDYMAELRARVVGPSVESYEWDGHLWALPLDAACHAALYRNDLVDATGLPQTWEAVASWAQAYHHPPHQYGLILSVEGVLGHCLFLSMMAGLDYPAFEDPEHPHCDPAAAAHVLTVLQDLLRLAPPGSTHWGPWDIYDHMVEHDDVGYSPSLFAYVNYFSGRTRSSHLRLGRVPCFAGHAARPILGGVGLGLAHTCSHVAEASAYGRFLMSEPVQNDIFPSANGQPATLAAWADAATNQRLNNFYQDLRPNMAGAYIRPRYPAFHALELRNGRILQQWWDGRLGLSEVIECLNQPQIE